MAKKSEREFENVNLLQGLMGGSKKAISDRSSTSNEQFLHPKNSTDSISTLNTDRGQNQLSAPSLDSDYGELVGLSPSIAAAPLPCRTHSCPEMTIPGSASPQYQADSSHHIHKSPVVFRSSSSPSSHTESSQIQRPCIRPVSEPNSGLNALFQQPIRLKPDSSINSTNVHLRTGSSGSHSLQDSLYTTSSMTSLLSHVSELGTDSESNLPKSQFSQHHITQHRPAPVSSSSDPGSKAVQNLREQTSRDFSSMEPRDQRVALSYLSTYQPRMSDHSAQYSGPGNDALHSVENTTSLVPLPMGASTDSDSSLLNEPPHSGLIIVTPDEVSRRDAADSQAWQRKTKMLQVNCYNSD